MSSNPITTALSQLSASVSNRVNNIKNKVEKCDETYKKNYECLMQLPIVQDLKKKNKALKKKNRALEKELLKCLLQISSLKTPSFEAVISDNTKKPQD